MFCQFERFEKRLVNLNQIVHIGHVCNFETALNLAKRLEV